MVAAITMCGICGKVSLDGSNVLRICGICLIMVKAKKKMLKI